ncbi:uncharacterized protein DS421_11g346430 [Arachis hypogaea]|uniref:Uncharacterized protein n=1 Tax=Arachis hypogaea TaxID=3818 RepID=A0A445AWQ5_ARAHY|nr:uncharacterized protein DS421_11g346430 [Arachis hypogaea]RYR30850.1 hypothetical protein Ahy_B01g055622 [Arachis hypogaea]
MAHSYNQIGSFRSLHGCPAKWAGGVGVEPHIDAFSVEGVVARGQDPTRFPFLELREANGTVDGVRVGLAGEGEDGKGGNHGGIEAAGGQHDGGVHVEYEVRVVVRVPADAMIIAAELARVSEIQAGVDVEAYHYGENEGDNDD